MFLVNVGTAYFFNKSTKLINLFGYMKTRVTEKGTIGSVVNDKTALKKNICRQKLFKLNY